MFRLKMLARIVVVVCLSGATSNSQAPPVRDLRALSGTWDGTMTIIQRGECPTPNGFRTDYPFRVVLTVNEDGSFTGQLLKLSGPQKGQPSVLAWTGKIQSDLSVTVTMHPMKDCKGQDRAAASAYSGKVTEKKGKYGLKLDGIDPILLVNRGDFMELCLESNCKYEEIFDLRKK